MIGASLSSEKWLSLVRLPARIWPAYDHLQSLRTLGTARYLGKPVPQTCRERTIHRHADDRFHARESAPLGGRRKRGEQKQAIGRSRGANLSRVALLHNMSNPAI